jgi:hypothetical protein
VRSQPAVKEIEDGLRKNKIPDIICLISFEKASF